MPFRGVLVSQTCSGKCRRNLVTCMCYKACASSPKNTINLQAQAAAIPRRLNTPMTLSAQRALSQPARSRDAPASDAPTSTAVSAAHLAGPGPEPAPDARAAAAAAAAAVAAAVAATSDGKSPTSAGTPVLPTAFMSRVSADGTSAPQYVARGELPSAPQAPPSLTGSGSLPEQSRPPEHPCSPGKRSGVATDAMPPPMACSQQSRALLAGGLMGLSQGALAESSSNNNRLAAKRAKLSHLPPAMEALHVATKAGSPAPQT